MKTFREFCMEEKQDNLDEIFGFVKDLGAKLAQTKLARQFKGELSAIFDDVYDRLPPEDKDIIDKVEEDFKSRTARHFPKEVGSPGVLHSMVNGALGRAQDRLRKGGKWPEILEEISEFLDKKIRQKAVAFAAFV